MRNECMGLINLNKKGDPNIDKLNYSRPIASTPIGGRYRMIDFTLSNMVNSGITNVGIFAKEKYRSLTDHIESGKDWDLSRKKGGLSIFSPENTESQNMYQYRKGDIYNILSNIDYIKKSEEEYILVAPSYMICNIDYSEALKYHKKSNNYITMIYKNIENSKTDFKGNLTLNLNSDNKVINVGSNISAFEGLDIYMETYIMKRTDFIDVVYKLSNNGDYLYLEDFIIEEVKNNKIGAYEYDGYLKCVKSVQTYFEISKDLLNIEIAKELLYSDRKIRTKEKNESPTIYTETADVDNSFIASGCVIEGTVKNSIIFRKVHIEKGVNIDNSVIMQNCIIGEGAQLQNVIFDKNINLTKRKELKGDENYPIVIEKNISI
ncbi:glucose-1-phosphate adenylyltransferase subunit GlgD [Romboutsia sedimentorum]|uniref:Glucose-1-phosphate adenylyltransferase subunit GlgD n=1 Tax=Romboutsia sedimentorum TaxID=1368474 RepID=A0ABT7ED59_9FIRM|nr:glucose-1-phosphate adenylyltransferase subunit GlgD [Romboutsia sedimentorum]MDK2564864.1 glucose-1-phosphate adenylyltransferase subunit GlgD [Romboutsia sedimentorum]MDK2587009.1 glucose-1-phosphate adenylyltransferase subunit GlgD [Romboutsia sedimentorum]